MSKRKLEFNDSLDSIKKIKIEEKKPILWNLLEGIKNLNFNNQEEVGHYIQNVLSKEDFWDHYQNLNDAFKARLNDELLDVNCRQIFFFTRNNSTHVNFFVMACIALVKTKNPLLMNLLGIDDENCPLQFLLMRSPEFTNEEYALIQSVVIKDQINDQDAFGNTLLHVSYGLKVEFIAFLLNSGAYLNGVNIENNTSLHNFLQKGFFHPDLITQENLILENNYYETPLILMCKLNRVELSTYIKVIKSDGFNIDLNQKNRFGYTPVLYCAREGYLVSLKGLYECGADFQVKDVSGLNALHIAILYDQLDIVTYLLEELGWSEEIIKSPEKFNLPTGGSIFALVHPNSNTMHDLLVNILDRKKQELSPKEISIEDNQVFSFFNNKVSSNFTMGLIEQKDCFGLKSIEWQKKCDYNRLNLLILEENRFRINLDKLDFFITDEIKQLLNKTFDQIYFTNPCHKVHYGENLLSDTIQSFIKILEKKGIVREFFDKNLTILIDRNNQAFFAPTLFSPYKDSLDFLKNPPKKSMIKGFYLPSLNWQEKGVTCVTLENFAVTHNIPSSLTHEWGHRWREKTDANLDDLKDYMNIYLGNSKNFLSRFPPNRRTAFSTILSFRSYPAEQRLEEFFVRILELCVFDEMGEEWIENSIPGITNCIKNILLHPKKEFSAPTLSGFFG